MASPTALLSSVLLQEALRHRGDPGEPAVRTSEGLQGAGGEVVSPPHPCPSLCTCSPTDLQVGGRPQERLESQTELGFPTQLALGTD